MPRRAFAVQVEHADRIKKLYPINPKHDFANALYTENVLILRSSQKSNYEFVSELQSKYKVNVCTIPVLDRRQDVDYLEFFSFANAGNDLWRLDYYALTITKKRIEMMFQVAINRNADVLVTGAFGCGPFLHDPSQITKLFNEVLKDYNGYIKKVVFGVDDEYYQIFRDTINH